jgi:hypothetical protein
MMSGRGIGREIAVLAVLSVLAIFLFPSVQGPYSVVHGPASALQAARAALRVRIAIVQSSVTSVGNGLISILGGLSCISFPKQRSQSAGLPEYNSILRC